MDGFVGISEFEFNSLLSSDISSYTKSIQEESNLKQQTNQREFGTKLIPTLIDFMGERNLTLNQNGTTINMMAIASDNSGIKLLIETGALKTARSLCGQLRFKYPTHADIYDTVISSITDFLTENGYE